MFKRFAVLYREKIAIPIEKKLLIRRYRKIARSLDMGYGYIDGGIAIKSLISPSFNRGMIDLEKIKVRLAEIDPEFKRIWEQSRAKNS